MRNVRILFFLLLWLITLPAILFGQTRPEVFHIGNGNEITVYGPFYSAVSILGSYQFEVLYRADEDGINLTADGELKALEFYVTAGIDLGLLSNLELYLKTTGEDELEEGGISNPEAEGYTKVEFSASLLELSLTTGTGHVVRFELDEGFPVSQGDNIAVHTRSSTALGVSLGNDWYATEVGTEAALVQSNAPILGNPPVQMRPRRPNVRLEFEVDAVASAQQSVLSAQRSPILADGMSTSVITLQVRTPNGDPVNSGGDNVNFSTTAGSLGPVTDHGNGSYTAVLTSATSPGTATVRATLNGPQVSDDAQVEFAEHLGDMFCRDLFTQREMLVGNPGTSDTTPRGILYNNLVSLTLGTYQYEAIYMQDEIGLDNAGFLRYIDFFVDLDINVDLLGQVGVYLKETTATTLSDGNVSLDGYTFIEGDATLLGIDANLGARVVRLELDEPFFYSNNANLSIHSRHFILADVNVGGNFHYTATPQNRTRASEDIVNILGITVGLTAPVATPNRVDARFGFDEYTSASLSESSLTADPTSLPADGESVSTLTAMIRTAGGQICIPESGAPEFFTTLGDIGDVTDEGDAVYTAPLTSATPGIATVSAGVDGEELNDKPDVEFFATTLPPDPDNTTITANPTSIAADGESTSTITVTLFDENGDRVETGGFDVDLDTDAGELSDVTDNGDGTYTATLTSSTTPETATITGTLEGEDIADEAQVQFVEDVLPPDPANTTITASPNQIPADGESTSTVTVTLFDENGDRVEIGGFDVDLDTDAGSLSDPIDNGDGTYTATLTSSTNEETATITGTLEGEDIDDTAQVQFVDSDVPPGPPHVDHITIEVDPDELPADGESEAIVTVTLYDEDGNRITEGGFCEDIALSTTLGTLGSINDEGDGTCTTTITAPEEPGLADITGTFEGDDIDDSAQIEFTSDEDPPGPPSPDRTTITADPTQIPADGESTSIITVTLRDADGRRVREGGFDVDLDTDAGSLSDPIDNGDGTYTATLTSSTNEETATITGTLEGEDIDDTAQVQFVDDGDPGDPDPPAVPDPDRITITANPTEIPADGESTSRITVTLFDENGDRITEGGFCSDINLQHDPDLGTLSGVEDRGNGTCRAILTAPTEPGVVEITGTYDGDDINDSAQVEFTSEDDPPGPPSPQTTEINANPTTIAANGESTSTVTVILRDADGRRVREGGFAVNLSTTAGSLGDVTDNDDGTYTAVLTSSTTPETATITGTLEGEDIDDNAQVQFVDVALPPDPGNTTITANPTELPADGESESIITVTLYDENGDRVEVGGFCETIELDLNPELGTLSGITDNSDGTCTATLTAPTTPGTVEITGTLGGEDIDDSAEVEFTDPDEPGPEPPTEPSTVHTIIEVEPTQLPGDGESTAVVTVTLYDENGNPITEGGHCSTIDLDLQPAEGSENMTSPGTLSEITDNGDGTCTAILTAPAETGTIIITGTIDGDPIDDTAELTFYSLFCEISLNYPNPFTDETRFMVSFPEAGQISFQVYDVLGKLVASENRDVQAGEQEFIFNSAAYLSSGVYIYRLVCPCQCEAKTGKMTRIRN